MDKDTSHLLFVCFFFTSSIYFKQSRLGLIGWGREMFGERQKKDSNKVEAREKPVVKFQSIKGKLLVFSSS